MMTESELKIIDSIVNAINTTSGNLITLAKEVETLSKHVSKLDNEIIELRYKMRILEIESN